MRILYELGWVMTFLMAAVVFAAVVFYLFSSQVFFSLCRVLRRFLKNSPDPPVGVSAGFPIRMDESRRLQCVPALIPANLVEPTSSPDFKVEQYLKEVGAGAFSVGPYRTIYQGGRLCGEFRPGAEKEIELVIFHAPAQEILNRLFKNARRGSGVSLRKAK